MTTEIKFPLISGNISMDLVNTEVVRHGTRHDLLTNTEHVLAWFDTLMMEKIIFKEQFRDLEQWGDHALVLLRELRSFLREGYENIADGKELSSDWIMHLELLMKKAPFTYHLKNDMLIPTPMGTPENVIASLIALDALKLISSDQLSNIRRCANPDCVLLFIDAHGRRKWCSMKICGNRSKVTRHQRQKAQKK
ncbi:CGNR zinc finger domain-containing protein [Bacillus sp. CLL-7-23]|uniref:CGNR zinc finger domain-containing protein n=1 Tax=Bacillus changyiensis TaxID=3004103 RepID=A0ABT4XA87_9BACI|nr:CGNR zinc finger domain-containing protein [Bacillus changyiensis]MDA7028326.1 CGNR zinc finger domain-containing protein [Bacillus changyiensis]